MGCSKVLDHNRFPDQLHSAIGTKRNVSVFGYEASSAEVLRCDLPSFDLVGTELDILTVTGGYKDFEKATASELYESNYDIIYKIYNTNRYMSKRVQNSYPDFNPLKKRLPKCFVGKQATLMFNYKSPKVKALVVEDSGPLTLFLVQEGIHSGKYITSLECQFSISLDEIEMPRYVAEVREYTATATLSEMWEAGSGYGKRKAPVTIKGPVVMDSVKNRRVATTNSIGIAERIASHLNSKENRT